jgi:hypothetical protein
LDDLLSTKERARVRGGGYHFNDLGTDDVFYEAGCFWEGFSDFARDEHHLLDFDLD